MSNAQANIAQSGRGHAPAGRPKTTGQVRAIFGEAKHRGLDEEAIRDVVEDVTKRTRHISELSHSEAQKVIQRLKADSFIPLRTMQYRRQKAGVKQLVTREQLTLIAELASQREGWTAESIAKLCKQIIKRERPITTTDANKVIEALKSMNKRAGLWSGADAA